MRIEVRSPFPIVIGLAIDCVGFGHPTLSATVIATLPDRDDPRRTIDIAISTRQFACPGARSLEDIDPQRRAECARRALREFLLHEADEWLHIDGVRAFDPHKPR